MLDAASAGYIVLYELFIYYIHFSEENLTVFFNIFILVKIWHLLLVLVQIKNQLASFEAMTNIIQVNVTFSENPIDCKHFTHIFVPQSQRIVARLPALW